MSENSYPAFAKFAAMLRSRGNEIDVAFGEVIVLMCREPHLSLALAARKMIAAGFTAEEIVVGLEAGEELRSMSPVLDKTRSEIAMRGERLRQEIRRDECDPETWSVLRAAVLRRDGSVCVYCGDRDGPFEADHVVPLSRGGRSTMRNLVCACRPCNSAKRDRTPEEWRAGS